MRVQVFDRVGPAHSGGVGRRAHVGADRHVVVDTGVLAVLAAAAREG